MMILVHSAPRSLEPYRHQNLGVLCSPRCVYGSDIENWPWAADNDAYSAWDAGRYRAMLQRIWGRRGCLFVTSPDVVGDGVRTLELFEEWYDELDATLQPKALVAQDGMTVEAVPWRRIDALFIGGTSEFKMGDAGRYLAIEAKRRGLWLHMGRVNSHQRFRYAKAIGCDSVDGTQFSWFKDAKLARFLAHAESEPQIMMQEGPPLTEVVDGP